jgi:hypothetical protein
VTLAAARRACRPDINRFRIAIVDHHVDNRAAVVQLRPVELQRDLLSDELVVLGNHNLHRICLGGRSAALRRLRRANDLRLDADLRQMLAKPRRGLEFWRRVNDYVAFGHGCLLIVKRTAFVQSIVACRLIIPNG